MLKLTNKKTVQHDTNTTITSYSVSGDVQLAMDSIWDYKGNSTVAVSSINVINETSECGEYSSTFVNVAHNTTWEIYTDSAFESAISNALNMDVSFTEQGMQEDGYASMETYSAA